MKKIVFIGGPTASGKTSIAVHLAKKFNGEIINADSRQIYKYLDIGTNKDGIKTFNTENSIEGVPIYLVSFLNPDKRYSVYDFKVQAIAHIEEILNKGKLPIIAGGTGLYIDSIIKNYKLVDAAPTEWRTELETKTLEELTQLLITKSNSQYLKLNVSDRQNPRRLIRLIEKLNSINNSPLNTLEYDYLFLYPKFNWEELVTKIEYRVEEIFKNGIVEETKKVLDLGFPQDSVALQGTGYKEVLMYINKEIDLAECINLVKISHRQYAKRQRTWFEGKGRGYDLKIVENLKDAESKLNNFINPLLDHQDY